MKLPAAYSDEFNLMRQFSVGEKPAFRALYDNYYSDLLGFAQRFVQEKANAEDIVSDSFIKLWNEKEKFGSLDHVRGFLFMTVKNACINFLRDSKARDQKHSELFDTLTHAGERQFQLEEIRSELMKLVFAEVHKLPRAKREIFLLAYRDGLKTAEIARLLGIKERTVTNQKAEAVKLLARALADSTLLLALILCLELY